ncbi:MAG: STAS domain-containing protein [Myxococcales bacterium]|nr:STAS domain-containing protein [Myxococcales bacterium]
MADGRVLYAHEGPLHVLRYVGEIRYPLAPSVDKFVNLLLANETVDDLVVDLSETDSIDSTNLGELVRIAQRLQERGSHRPVIISTQESIRQLLCSMCLDEIFQMTEAPAPEVPTSEEITDGEAPNRAELGSVMLEAHRSLAAVDKVNQERFCDVIALMELEAGEVKGHS